LNLSIVIMCICYLLAEMLSSWFCHAELWGRTL